ncbi:MAG: M28 family peptidase, partial [Bacteroidetes bacterium]
MSCKHFKNLFLLLAILALQAPMGCKSDHPPRTVEDDLEPVVVPRFERDSAFQFVAAQVAFGPRVPNTEAHLQCKDWLVEKFKSYGLEVIEQPFKAKAFYGEHLKGYNIMAQYRPELSKRILLAAHWDSRFHADSPLNEERREEPILGADDGGSGVA